MAGPVFTNNAVGTLAASYGVAATAVTLTAGQGNLFPSPAVGDWFPVTVVDASNNIEVMRCTARTSDTLTVVRGQEGTAARALSAGNKIEHRLTAAALNAIRNGIIDPTQIPANSITGSMIAPGAITTGKLADGSVSAAKIADGNVTAGKLDAGVAVANLGFTPVHQGGTGFLQTDTVYIGWTSVNKLGLYVGTTNLGYLLSERQDGDPAGGGYRGVPLNPQNSDYAIGLVDAGRAIMHTSGLHTYVIPADGTNFAIGSTIEIINLGGTVNIGVAGGVSLIFVPNGAVGGRVLAANGVATIQKCGSNYWIIYGAGLT